MDIAEALQLVRSAGRRVATAALCAFLLLILYTVLLHHTDLALAQSRILYAAGELFRYLLPLSFWLSLLGLALWAAAVILSASKPRWLFGGQR